MTFIYHLCYNKNEYEKETKEVVKDNLQGRKMKPRMIMRLLNTAEKELTEMAVGVEREEKSNMDLGQVGTRPLNGMRAVQVPTGHSLFFKFRICLAV